MCGGKKGDNEVKQTQGEKEIAAIAAEKWNHWVKNLSPMMDEFIDRSQMKDHDYQQAEGAANVDTQAAYGDMPQVSPGEQRGGNLAVSIAGKGLDKGRSLASNMVSANMQTDDRHLAGLKAIVAAGQGVDSEAQAGLSDIASMNAQRAAHDANMAQQKSNLYSGAAGTALGIGAHMMTPSQNLMDGITPRDNLMGIENTPNTLQINGMQYDTGMRMRR